MKVGILALQGAVDLHQVRLRELGSLCGLVRNPQDLEGLSGLIIPGGESTTMMKLIERHELLQPLQRFIAERPTLGLCAGAILLAREVRSPEQPSLAMMDIRATRNGYGRQLDSFVAEVHPDRSQLFEAPLEGVFIRAPFLESLREQARVELVHEDRAVLISQGHLLAASFHPELSQDLTVHSVFLDMVRRTSP